LLKSRRPAEGSNNLGGRKVTALDGKEPWASLKFIPILRAGGSGGEAVDGSAAFKEEV